MLEKYRYFGEVFVFSRDVCVCTKVAFSTYRCRHNRGTRQKSRGEEISVLEEGVNISLRRDDNTGEMSVLKN